jgi:hypothetical protein
MCLWLEEDDFQNVLFFSCHFTALSVSGIFRVGDRMINKYGAVGGMRTGRGNQSTRRKPISVPLFLPRIPNDVAWGRTRAAMVGSRQLTAWAMEQSESESRYDRRSVGQSVLVSSPIWGSWPEVKYCLTIRVSWSRASPLTKGRVCHLSLSLSVYCQSSIDGIYNY